MAPHYFIGISIREPAFQPAEHFRNKYGLPDKYKVIPHKDDLHITLRYIGELMDESKKELLSLLHKTGKEHTEFTTVITGMAFFGSPSGPRVVYLSVDSVNPLLNLQRQIARRTERVLGLEKEARFVPHITIAKKRKTSDKLQLAKEEIPPVPVHISGFTLFKIHPGVRPSYEAVEYFPLKKD